MLFILGFMLGCFITSKVYKIKQCPYIILFGYEIRKAEKRREPTAVDPEPGPEPKPVTKLKSVDKPVNNVDNKKKETCDLCQGKEVRLGKQKIDCPKCKGKAS